MRRVCGFFAAGLAGALALPGLLPEAEARPEYALRIRTNRCATCHTNPAGGGHRNLTGRAFAPSPPAAGEAVSPLQEFLSQDMFGFDWRVLAYAHIAGGKGEDKHKGALQSISGPAAMAAVPSVSIPFYKSKGREWRFVYSYNIGGYYRGSRDSYLRIKLYDDYRKYPQFITFGQFAAPFGLMTDEHRTYVRMQTRTTWNQQKMGVLLSGGWTPALSYDLAFVNEGETEGARSRKTDSEKKETDLKVFAAGLGGFANVRYLSTAWGWMAGASASYHNNKHNSAALSLYQALDLNSLTRNKLPGAFLAEGVLGYKTNSQITSLMQGGDFAGARGDDLANSNSLGALVRWNYDFLPKWGFVFKYDHFNPDIKYTGDYYQRFGLGLKHFFNSQTILEGRGVLARASPKAETKGSSPVTQNALWLLLQVKM